MGKLLRRLSKHAGSGKRPAEAQQLDSDSDISLMTDSDLEEERRALHASLSKTGELSVAAAPAADPFQQASLWAEVDRNELERIAINIARNAVPPSSDSTEAAAATRLSISAAAVENDMTDPLGYGRIDTRLLTLSRDIAAGGKPRFSTQFGTGGALEGSQRLQPSSRGRNGEQGGSGQQSEPSPALRSKVLPGSEQFEAELYLGVIHADTQLPELLRGLHNLRQQLSEHTGQLKALVKENFDRFISSKNTIDTVYAKLQRAEVEGEAGVNGASTNEVMESVLQVQGEAQRAFGSLLDRQAKADRIRLVLGVMQRYEAIVQLPSRVRQHAEAGDYEQVVADYRKAKALLADQGSSSAAAGRQAPVSAEAVVTGQQQDASMWVKLMDEIDKVVRSVVLTLETAVRSPQSSTAEAHDAIKHMLQLKAVGVPAAQDIDPVVLYVECQERHVKAMLEAQLQKYNARLDALRRQQQQSAEFEAQAASLASLGISAPPSLSGINTNTTGHSSDATGSSPSASGPPSAVATPRSPGGRGDSKVLASAMETAAVQYVAHITSGLCQWLPGFWLLTQHRLPALAGIGNAAGAVERGMAAAERSVGMLLSLYRAAVHALLANPGGFSLSHAGLLAMMAELAAGCLTLQQTTTLASGSGSEGTTSVPAAAVGCLQELVQHAMHASLVQLAAHLAAAVSQLCAAEDFQLTHASQRNGVPATTSLVSLKHLIQQGMAHLKALQAEATRADVAVLKKSAAPARNAFFGCLTAFAEGQALLAASLLNQPQPLQLLPMASDTAATVGGRQDELAAQAAMAAAAASSGFVGSREPAATSSSRRLLVLCANLCAARSQLLPQQYARWAALLQATSGCSGKDLQAAAQACSAELEAAETRLAGAYIDRKQAVLDDVMEQLLFADGTAWQVVPPPTGLRPVALELVHGVVAVQAELAAVAPALLHDVLEELLLGLLDGFAQVLSQGTPQASAGGVAQLWLEGSFLLATVGGLAGDALRQAGAHLQAALDGRLEAALSAAEGVHDGEMPQLAAWLANGGPAVKVTVERSRQHLTAMCKRAQAAAWRNAAPLEQLVVPGK